MGSSCWLKQLMLYLSGWTQTLLKTGWVVQKWSNYNKIFWKLLKNLIELKTLQFCEVFFFVHLPISWSMLIIFQVYIHNNELHIIPPPQTPADVTMLPASTPTLQEAVNCVQKFASRTRASNGVLKALKARIAE